MSSKCKTQMVGPVDLIIRLTNHFSIASYYQLSEREHNYLERNRISIKAAKAGRLLFPRRSLNVF